MVFEKYVSNNYEKIIEFESNKILNEFLAKNKHTGLALLWDFTN